MIRWSSFFTGLSALTTSQRRWTLSARTSRTPARRAITGRWPAWRRDIRRKGTACRSARGCRSPTCRRMRDGLLEAAVTQHGSELSDTTAQLAAMRQIESFLNGGEGSIHDRLEAFFNQLEQLSARPDDSTLRQGVLGGRRGADRSIRRDGRRIQPDPLWPRCQIDGVVREIGPMARQIAELNASIQRSEVRGIDANDLRDQRDQLVNELADRAGIRVIEQDFGQTTILLGGAALVVGNQAAEIRSTIDDQGTPSSRSPDRTNRSRSSQGARSAGCCRCEISRCRFEKSLNA